MTASLNPIQMMVYRLKMVYQPIKLAFRLYAHTPEMDIGGTNYDRYWKSKRGKELGYLSPFQRKRFDWIAPKIEKGASVLDIGAGDGGILTGLISERSIHPIAADVSDIVLSHLAHQGISTVKIDLNDSHQINELPEIDYIILFEILEHLSAPEKLLLELQKKVKKGIFISIPNTGYFPYRLRMLSGRFVMQWRLHPGEHLRFWTYRDFKWWLQQLGLFDVSDIALYEGIPILNKIWGSLFGMGIICQIRIIDKEEDTV